MKPLSTLILTVALMGLTLPARSQVLISLLFGDALNSDKVEFGLTGGYNRSWMLDIEDSEGLNNFNLGFYFHINLKGSSYLSTGVLVKSNVGASGMPTYPVGNESFDDIFAEGELTKKMSCFYVPILFHQRFNNRWYAEAGITPGLRSKAKDIFELEAFDGELSYTRNVSDAYKRIDFGLQGGVGYKWTKEIKSVSTGINYFYGLVNMSNIPDTTIKNSSVYFFVRLPIGAGGKEKKEQAN
jgi:hypothetical protein